MKNKDEIACLNRLFTEAEDGSAVELEAREYHLYEEAAEKLPYILSNTDWTETKNIALLIKGKKGLTLNGNGAVLVCHGRLQPITLDGCRDITVKNLSITWEIPLSAEGNSFGGGEGYTDFAVDSVRFPHRVRDEWLYFQGENWEEPLWRWGHTCFDPVTERVPVGSGDSFRPVRAQALENGAVRLWADYAVPAGTLVVLRHNPRCHAGVFAEDCEGLILEGIRVHGTGGLGILCQFCKDLTFRKIRFEADASRGRRLVGGHDDGIHLPNDRGHVLVENCFFHGLMDDAINLHGVAVQVEEIIDRHTLSCCFMHAQAKGFALWAREGDEVSFLNHTSLAATGKGTVEAFRLTGLERFQIRFREEIPDVLHVGDALENISNTASLTCRGNYFGMGRARGLLVSSPRAVRIEGNYFETAGSAILLAGDANQWFETGACHDVIICHNVFHACLSAMYQFCEAIISICPEIPEPDAEKPFHSGIRIEGNVFEASDYPVLYAFSAEDVLFCENLIVRDTAMEPWHPTKHMLNFSYCRRVRVACNRILGEVLGQDVFLCAIEKEQVSVSGGLAVLTDSEIQK